MADEQVTETPVEKPVEEQVKPVEKQKPAPIDETLNLEPTPNEEAPKVEPVEIKKTGIEKVDSIGELLVSKNIPDADKIMKEFTKTGDLSMASKAALMEGLGESVGNLVLSQLQETATSAREASQKAQAELKDYAKEQFSAEDADLTWKQIQEFVRTEEAGYSEADRQAMNKMLANGGLQARLVIDNIAKTYYSLESSSSPTDLLEGDSRVAGDFNPLSKSEYVSELRELVNKYGEQSVQVQQLRRRRELSRARGY